MPASIKVKVSKDALIAALRKHDAECESNYAKAVKAYELAVSQYPAKLAAFLTEGNAACTDLAKWVKANKAAIVKAVRAAERDEEDEDVLAELRERWSEVVRKRRTYLPSKPSKPTKPRGNVDFVELLEASSQDELVLSEEQYEWYMRNCRI